MYGGFSDYFTHMSAEPESDNSAFDLHEHSSKDIQDGIFLQISRHWTISYFFRAWKLAFDSISYFDKQRQSHHVTDGSSKIPTLALIPLKIQIMYLIAKFYY